MTVVVTNFCFRVVRIKIKDTNLYLEKIQRDPYFKGVFGQSLDMILFWNQARPQAFRHKICKDIFLTIPVVIFARKNYFLLDALDEKLDILKAAGLIEFWNFQDVEKGILNFKESNGPKILTTRHLLGCFHILISGCIVSSLVFLLELSIILMRRHNRRDHK